MAMLGAFRLSIGLSRPGCPCLFSFFLLLISSAEVLPGVESQFKLLLLIIGRSSNPNEKNIDDKCMPLEERFAFFLSQGAHPLKL
ncbi:hypothetical protein O6P43_016949 [Quillaja saponaria]|uniref:Secreted protein n=1 Tax=Quillaja saponaria TaxID=32244 RepID=A0AAD7LNV5_QUISA|nr:hypothetical protein O6P43_016949 [Quillaja saponaria]